MTPDARASSARLCRALMFGVCLVLAPPKVSAQEAQIDFDITAQPLAAALEQYGAVAGRNILYNSNLTAGLHSSAVRGPLTADAALARLLAGSGLSARVLGETSFALYPAPATAQAALPVPVNHYYARLQTVLRTALCAEADARPGRYRIALQFWIDPAGNVERFARLGSAGSAAVDAGIDHALRRMQVDAPPPPGLAQPVTLVVVPQGSRTTMACNGSPARRASATP
ncbi:energy transducer TonB [Bradyrhizobium sp. 41S5]|uniref:energy transducer TonB family protein n=1 Tax=Bradyrhizobium sp. 41S5 TaxID=1404443 RepID=UPI00156BC287|nr:energy transducer TonB [Bradyrhizobium sp. 41S5]UFX47590.1 energy transducer TonB [Bradyrhizobium sp. 41S5]